MPRVILCVLWQTLKCLFTALSRSSPTAEQIKNIAELLEEIQKLFINHKEDIKDLALEILTHASSFRKILWDNVKKLKEQMEEQCFAMLCIKTILNDDQIDFSLPTYFMCVDKSGAVQELGPTPLSEQELRKTKCSCSQCCGLRQLLGATEGLIDCLECFENTVSSI